MNNLGNLFKLFGTTILKIQKNHVKPLRQLEYRKSVSDSYVSGLEEHGHVSPPRTKPSHSTLTARQLEKTLALLGAFCDEVPAHRHSRVRLAREPSDC